MTSRAVISLAILKVNWDELKTDYLENFVPIVAECIRLSQEDVVSLPNLQADLQNRFGLRIPQNAINAILRRVHKRGYIRSDNKIYKRNTSKLEGLNFHGVQQQVLRMHESVIDHLIRFCAERFSTAWSLIEAENAFQAYAEENQLLIISSQDFTPLISSSSHVAQSSKYIVGAFVQHLLDTHSSDFEYVETIVKGNLLANAIFLPDPNKANRKFRKTQIYFDTSFLVFALGYAGRARRDPCTELLNMLYENGAELRCFKHTLEEVRGVLDACAYRIGQGQLREAYGPSIEYFISIGSTASDIELYIAHLERIPF